MRFGELVLLCALLLVHQSQLGLGNLFGFPQPLSNMLLRKAEL